MAFCQPSCLTGRKYQNKQSFLMTILRLFFEVSRPVFNTFCPQFVRIRGKYHPRTQSRDASYHLLWSDKENLPPSLFVLTMQKIPLLNNVIKCLKYLWPNLLLEETCLALHRLGQFSVLPLSIGPEVSSHLVTVIMRFASDQEGQQSPFGLCSHSSKSLWNTKAYPTILL